MWFWTLVLSNLFLGGLNLYFGCDINIQLWPLNLLAGLFSLFAAIMMLTKGLRLFSKK